MTATDFFDFRPEAVASRLDLTVDVMRELSRATDPQAMYQVYTRRMAAIFPTARQISLSRRDLAAPRIRVTRFNLWTHEVNPWVDVDRLPVIERGLLSELVYDGRPRIIDELVVPPDDPAAPFLNGQRSLMAIPLFDGGDAINMVVLTREEPAAFPVERCPELVWMSNLFGRATRAALLTQQLHAANEQAQHEIRQIAKLQRALLPTELPRVSTLDLAVYSRSTSTAGGDYYDVLSLPRGRVGLLIADVCGHGASSAMLVAVVHSLVRTYSGPPVPPGHLLAYVNDHLTRMYTRSFGTFVTALYAVYDPDRALLTWANAGHPPPRLLRADGSREVLNGERCVPLGIVDGTEYPQAEVAVKPGDQLLLHTDGVTDAKNGTDETFGTDRLDAAVGPGPAAAARGMINGVLAALEKFTNGTPPADDYTLMAMKFVKSRKKAGEISGEWRALGS
ncbi:MAG TPA: SpoIIE family protein phosphatase [Gemmataceae bacterium]|nr:SpoIIE family protein phosphatase [Gemmataceae bacterium]